jgi:DNA polymerase III delta prime subunit
MKILPTKFNSAESPPTCAADFIGDARDSARKLERIVQSSIENGCAPIKLFYSGVSGIGKTSLAYYARRLLGANKWIIREFNGTDVTIDAVREISDALFLTHNEMFGPYRIIEIHEADKMTEAAQVKLLTVLDNLPPHTAVICTTNKPLKFFEVRFQRRFKFTELRSPKADEIKSLLMRWPIPEPVAKMIADAAGGNVGLALNEAEEWLQTAPEAEVVSA